MRRGRVSTGVAAIAALALAVVPVVPGPIGPAQAAWARAPAGVVEYAVVPERSEARRDNYLRRNTLETERYPTITFGGARR